MPPAECRHCGQSLPPQLAQAPTLGQVHRYQVCELPPLRVQLIEYQCHKVACPHCGHPTRAELPAEVQTSGFGPRLASLIAYLTVGLRLPRHAVIWRKGSFGNQSRKGEVATARLLTVARTCVMQRRNALEFLSAQHAGLPFAPQRDRRIPLPRCPRLTRPPRLGTAGVPPEDTSMFGLPGEGGLSEAGVRWARSQPHKAAVRK